MPALLEELVLLPLLELVPVFELASVFGLALVAALELFELGYVELLLELVDPGVPGVVLGAGAVLGAEDCAPVAPPLDVALLALCACASVAPASPSAVSSANDLSLSMMYTSFEAECVAR
jgi:hypothetical protein